MAVRLLRQRMGCRIARKLRTLSSNLSLRKRNDDTSRAHGPLSHYMFYPRVGIATLELVNN
jgi:hypothetical protein